MVRGFNLDALAAQMSLLLREDESFLVPFPAISPPPEYGSGFVPAPLVPVIWAVHRWEWKRTSRKQARRSLFPLAPRMVLAITERRLLVWSARRGWRLGTFLGYVGLDSVVQAETTTIGQGWRTLVIHLANEPDVSIKVPGKLVDEIAHLLSGGVANPPPDDG